MGVPDEPAQPNAGAGSGDGVRDGEPPGELRLLERGEGDRCLRRRRVRARPEAGSPAARRNLPERPSRPACAAGRVRQELASVYDYGQLYLYDAAAAASG